MPSSRERSVASIRDYGGSIARTLNTFEQKHKPSEDPDIDNQSYFKFRKDERQKFRRSSYAIRNVFSDCDEFDTESDEEEYERRGHSTGIEPWLESRNVQMIRSSVSDSVDLMMPINEQEEFGTLFSTKSPRRPSVWAVNSGRYNQKVAPPLPVASVNNNSLAERRYSNQPRRRSSLSNHRLSIDSNQIPDSKRTSII